MNIVIIPIYKSVPTRSEKASLLQCINILSLYDFCLIVPKSLDISFYENIFNTQNKTYKIERFEDNNFKSVETYSKLCLSLDFYKRFEKYNYMFLYQLDGWIFKDELDFWCKKDYDYIGAPWFIGHDKAKEDSDFIEPSGNGGVCLRKISSFIKILSNKEKYHNKRVDKLPQYAKNYSQGHSILLTAIKLPRIFCKTFEEKNLIKWYFDNINEDYVIIKCFPLIDKNFKIAPTKVAKYFSFEVLPKRLFELTSKQLPFACHAWEKYEPDFWKEYIKF